MTRLLDDARREEWARLGEPERPPPLRPDQMIDKGEVKLLRDSALMGGPDYEERVREQEAEYEAAAREQIAWEAKAREQSAAWRERLETEESGVGEGEPSPSPLEGEGSREAAG